MKKLLASSMGSNEKVNSNKLCCTLKISKGLIEYLQKKINFFVTVLTDAGYPILWFNAPMAIGSFLESYDLSGKTIFSFCTSQDNDISVSMDYIKAVASRANVLDHAIEDGKIKPLIDLPTYNNTSREDSGDYSLAIQLTNQFHNEIVNDLISAVESKYSTYDKLIFEFKCGMTIELKR